MPAESSKQFEAALEQQLGPHALALLTAKHLYCSLPLPVLKQLGVKRFLQLPGYAVLTFPVSPSGLCRLPCPVEELHCMPVL